MLMQVSAHCWVRRSDFCQSNTVVVTGEDGVLVVDPGVTGAELTTLSQELRALGLTPTMGFSTHPHWDHMLWVRDLGDGPRWATPRAAHHAHAHLEDARAKAGRLAPGNEPELVGQLSALPVGARTLEWAGPLVEVLEHDGHAPGHAALYLPGDGVLIAGDMLSDVEVPLLDLKSGAPDPLGDYERGLTRLEQVQERGCRVVIPGHGAVATGEDVAVRFLQDRSYLHALRRPDPVHDPRLDPDATYGPDWLIPEHQAQRAWCLDQRTTEDPDPMPGAITARDAAAPQGYGQSPWVQSTLMRSRPRSRGDVGMWWLWVIVGLAVITALVVALQRRGSTGVPGYQPTRGEAHVPPPPGIGGGDPAGGF